MTGWFHSRSFWPARCAGGDIERSSGALGWYSACTQSLTQIMMGYCTCHGRARIPAAELLPCLETVDVRNRLTQRRPQLHVLPGEGDPALACHIEGRHGTQLGQRECKGKRQITCNQTGCQRLHPTVHCRIQQRSWHKADSDPYVSCYEEAPALRH